MGIKRERLNIVIEALRRIIEVCRANEEVLQKNDLNQATLIDIVRFLNQSLKMFFENKLEDIEEAIEYPMEELLFT